MLFSQPQTRLVAATTPDRRYMMLVPPHPDSEALRIELKLIECWKCIDWNECKKRIRLFHQLKQLQAEKSWNDLIREVGDR